MPDAHFASFSKDDAEQSIPERFEAQVRLFPNRIAVEDAASTLTYGELNRMANRIAAAVLTLRGPGSEPVALLLGTGIPVIAAMLGVLKAGKFYIPVDASQPPARSAAILAECGPALVITDSVRLKQASVLEVPWLNIDALDAALSAENPGLVVAAGDLGYVLYTSGSTGNPKGVMHDHRYVLHLTMVYTHGGQISAADRLALLYSPAFAGAVRDVYCALLNGAALVVFDVKGEGLTRLADWLRQKHITVFFAVATMFRHFCRLLTPEDRFPSVRLIELGSETVYAGDVHLYQRHFSRSCRMVVNLGGSEISPICQFLIDHATRIEGATVPAGYPAEDVELLLWNTEGRSVAAGAPGEIVVRSRYLSRGYWRRPDLTDAAFLPDPDGGERRLFRTGDLGRLQPDGCLLHLGRRDFQVKIRGYRVETAEIEAFLTATGLVRDAAVTAWVDSTGEQNLAAWLVPVHPDAPPSIHELRALITSALPDYMTPASFVILDALPVTESGKLDRRALPDPRWAGKRMDAADASPRTPVERRLQEIWSTVLDRESIDLHENFFELGGNSLSALQVVARIAAVFRVMLSPNCLFEHCTLARLAVAVECARRVEAEEAILPGQHGTETPLSFAQQRLWVLSGVEGPSDTFNIVRAFRLEGFLDRAALDKALREIGARHESLRTVIRMVGGNPVQAIAPECASVVSFVDLRHVPEGSRTAALEASLRMAHSRRFDLAQGPLWSVRVIQLAGNQHVLHLAMHHIISDDWSVQVLLRELSTIYNGFLAGTQDPLPPLPVQYADYALWQRRWLTGERLAMQLGYWQDHLKGAPPVMELPIDRPRESAGRFRAGMVRLHLGSQLTTRLRGLSRESETTLFVTLLAAYALLLSRYGNPADAVIGTVLANRYPVEAEGLIGFFVNTLPLRIQWPDEATFREIQACAHRSAVNGYAHPDVPFDRVVETLRPDRDVLHSPVFQTLFVLQNVPGQELILPGMITTPLDLDRTSAGSTFDLTLSLRETGGELCGALEFNAAIFDISTIEQMAERFKSLLTGVVESPDAPADGPATRVATNSRQRFPQAHL